MDINTDRIVVGVDGSRSSVAALRYAARMADALGSPIEAVIAWTYPVMSDPAFIANWSPEDDAERILDAAIDEAFGDSTPEQLTRTVLPGPPARALVNLSEDSAMLVVGSRGHGGFVGMLLGSVSSACAAHAHCPVLIVRTDHDTGDPGAHGAAAGADAAESPTGPDDADRQVP